MKNPVINFLLLGFVGNIFFAESAIAQISREGTPPSEIYSNFENINNLPIIIMEEFDIDKLIEEDKLPENRINKHLRFTKAFDVDIDVKEEGLLEILPNNNKQSKILAIQPVEGDEIIIEYSEPYEITNPGTLIISRVGHDYKGILKRLNPCDDKYGLVQWCNVDINCPAGDDWQTEK